MQLPLPRTPSSTSLHSTTSTIMPFPPPSRKPSISSTPTPDDHPGSSYFSLTRTTSTATTHKPSLTRRPSTSTHPLTTTPTATAPTPHALHSHLTETCSKRIHTLDYLRRAHEGRAHWFNTLHIPRAQQHAALHHSNRRLWVRAKTHFVLGYSLPNVLDVDGDALDVLRALAILMGEFEVWLGTRGGRAGSVSAADPAPGRVAGAVGKLFSRAAGHRRGSESVDSAAVKEEGGGGAEGEWVYLQIPHTPFELEYTEVLATLCDTLTEVYARVLQEVDVPERCTPAVGEAFARADARIRRVLVQGVVREWEEAVKVGVRKEVLAVGREVVGGFFYPG